MKMTTEENGTSRPGLVLHAAIELAKGRWLIGSAAGLGQRARRVSVAGGDWQGVLAELERARAHFGLAADAPAVCCYEAGQDGFWLYRCLEAHGVSCRVVDAGSIRRRVGRRHRKTDRLDVETLLRDLLLYETGEHSVFRVVRVPSKAVEDLRRIQRERRVLSRNRTAELNRMRGLLACHGIRPERVSKLGMEEVEALRTWDGEPLGLELKGQLRRCMARLEQVEEQMTELEQHRRELLSESPEEYRKVLETVSRLMTLCGVGPESAWTLGVELYGWRGFRNRRQVGGFLGLCGTPHQSGEMDEDLGIGKDGPGWVRALMIELAWGWLRYQPDSALSQWYRERFDSGKRSRRRGIVALARRLAVVLWQYLEYGEVPEGAALKAEAA